MLRTVAILGLLTAVVPFGQGARRATAGEGYALVHLGRHVKSTGLGPKMEALRDRIQETLKYYESYRLNTRDHSPWQAMHMVIAYGVKTKVHVGDPRGEARHAIGLLCFNQPFSGGQILRVEGGRPVAAMGAGLQGHEGQLLAVLAQAKLKRDYPLVVGRARFTVDDLVESEKLTCRADQELTFKLIGISHYLPSDAKWQSDDGQTWTIERMIREEIAQPIQGAPCGGSHRLMGLSYAVRRREKHDKPLTGEFRRAATYLADYHRYAFELQNGDGSFSTSWLDYRNDRGDTARRLYTTGHIAEWLAFSLSPAELREPGMVRAIDYLTHVLWENRNEQLDIGSLGHSLHALALYDRRAFKIEKTPSNPSPKADGVPISEGDRNQPESNRGGQPENADDGGALPLLRAPDATAPGASSDRREAPSARAAITLRRIGRPSVPSPSPVPHVSSDTGPLLIPPQPLRK